MNNITFTEYEIPINEDDINKLENKYEFIFPKDIRAHYLMFNGGSPNKCVINQNDKKYVIQQIIPIKYGIDHFEIVYKSLILDNNIFPKQMIPFAIDPSGDYYCFSINNESYGNIFIYRGENYEEKDKALIYISKSYNELLTILEND